VRGKSPCGLPDGGLLVNGIRDPFHGARHIELKVVLLVKTRVIDHVPHRFGARGLQNPEDFVPWIQMDHYFRLYAVFIHDGRNFLSHLVAHLSKLRYRGRTAVGRMI